MQNLIIALFATFLLTGCSLEDISPSKFFDNARPKQSKTSSGPSRKHIQASRRPKHLAPSQTKRKHTRKPHRHLSVDKLPHSYLYYLHSATLPELRHYLDSGRAAEDLPLDQYTLLRERRKGMEEDALIQYGTLKELIAAYDKDKNPRLKRRILMLMKEKEKSSTE